MGLFGIGKKSSSVPDRAASPARKSTASSASDWMPKPNNPIATRSSSSTPESDKMAAGIESRMKEKPSEKPNLISSQGERNVSKGSW